MRFKIKWQATTKAKIRCALFTNPNLIVMNEAASSLDASPENLINESI